MKVALFAFVTQEAPCVQGPLSPGSKPGGHCGFVLKASDRQSRRPATGSVKVSRCTAGPRVVADRRHGDSDLPVDYPWRRCPANVAPAFRGSRRRRLPWWAGWRNLCQPFFFVVRCRLRARCVQLRRRCLPAGRRRQFTQVLTGACLHVRPRILSSRPAGASAPKPDASVLKQLTERRSRQRGVAGD
jgi:hypothetical protein